MEMYLEILQEILAKEKIEITFPNLQVDANKLIEIECYKALQKIKAVLDDDSLDDAECFMRIEEIVCVYEQLGSGGGCRHDF